MNNAERELRDELKERAWINYELWHQASARGDADADDLAMRYEAAVKAGRALEEST